MFTDKNVIDEGRSSYWWTQIVSQTFSAGDWLNNFWMSRDVCLSMVYLCNELAAINHWKNSCWDEKCSYPCNEKGTVLTLLFLATNADYCYRSVCCYCENFTAQVHSSTKRRMVKGFQDELGLPVCHILIMFPMECPADYLIERVCTLLCMEWWTIWVDLLRCTSGGLEDCTMQGCFPTRSCLRLPDSVPPTHINYCACPIHHNAHDWPRI